MSITTESDLRRFLSSKDVPCHEVEALSGASANFCWRITTFLGRRSITKHAAPYIRIMPNVPLPPERMGFEYLALTTVPDILFEDEHVRLPQVYNYFPEEHVICMSDAGLRGLGESYKNNNNINMPLLGQRIGLWLARLHRKTSEPEMLKVVKEKFDSNFSKSVFQYTYNGLAPALKEHGYNHTLGDRINARFGNETDSDKICLCHGDFWLPNIQLEDQNPAVKVDEDTKFWAPALTIIDWENVRVGNGATDVGRFAADSWLHDRFHGSKGMFEAFLTTYLAERPLNQYEKIRLVVQFAVHIIFYSKMRWSDEEGTKQLVQMGKEMLEAIEAEDLGRLMTGPLGQLYS